MVELAAQRVFAWLRTNLRMIGCLILAILPGIYWLSRMPGFRRIVEPAAYEVEWQKQDSDADTEGERFLRERVANDEAEVRDWLIQIKEWQMTRALERKRRILKNTDIEHMDTEAATEKALADEELELKAFLAGQDACENLLRQHRKELDDYVRLGKEARGELWLLGTPLPISPDLPRSELRADHPGP